MSTMLLWRGGVTDPTTQIAVAIWPDVIGDYVLTFNGTSETINVPSVTDLVGCTWRLFAGLTPGATYSVSVTGPAGSASMVASTAAVGHHKTIVSSCYSWVFWVERVAGALVAEAPDQVISVGDCPYVDGGNMNLYSNDPTDNRLRELHQRFFKRPSAREISQAGAWIRAASDHDYLPGNDAPGRDDIGAFPGADACNETATLCNSEAEWIAMRANNRAIWQTLNRWPTNPEVGQTFGGGAVPADAEYTRWTVGRVEYFLVDMLSYADYRGNTGTTSRTLLGAVQKAWLLARLAASTATFKVVLFPQLLLSHNAPGVGQRPDYGHANFSQERDALIAAMTNTSGWAVPGGVVVATGDVHSPTAYLCTTGEKLLQICPCPSGTDMLAFSTPGIGDATDTDWLWWEQYPTSGDPLYRYYGVIEDTGSGPLRVSMKRSDNSVCGRVYLIDPGSNAPRYERTRVGR